GGHPAGGDPRRRPGLARLPIAVGRGHYRLRARPTESHRVQDHDDDGDLREDWPAALRHSGFDESQPTAWSAEGLLAYLPPEAQDRLFDNITALSMPGSQLATEYHLDGGAAMGERGKAMGDHWRAHGFDVDLSELFYPGERSHVVEYLSGHGWTVSA